MITKLIQKISQKLIKGKNESDVPGFVSLDYRENMLTWHRTDIAVTDVYEIMETLGQGHMGEVYKVRRKQENRGLHNDSTRNKTTAAEEELRRRGRPRSKSPISKSRRKKKDIAKKNEETLNLYKVNHSADKSSTSPNTKPRPILRKPSYGVLPTCGLFESGELLSRSDVSTSVHLTGTGDDLSLSGRGSGISEKSDVSISRTSGYYIDSDDDGSSSIKLGSPKRLIPKRVVRFQRHYACKTVITTKVKKDQLDELMNEIYIMRQMDHPYIIRLYEVYQIKRKLWLVMNLCTGGDLTTRKLREPEVTVVTEQILRGVAYLHSRGVCHRDLKLENIIYEHGGADSNIRLIDFGLSATYDHSESRANTIGTAYTMSPEVASKSGPYTEKSDVWAIGVIIWVLLAGDYPFIKTSEDLNDEKKKSDLVNARYKFGITWKGRAITIDAKNFVKGCLCKSPKDRWTAKDALKYLTDTWIPSLEVKAAREAKSQSDDNNDEVKKRRSNADIKMKSETLVVLKQTISAKARNPQAFFDDAVLNSIERFTEYGPLKRTILITCANTVDRAALKKMRELFLLVDTTVTGTISMTELKAVIQALRPDVSDSYITNIFVALDNDESGQIHYNEFVAAVLEKDGLLTEDRLADAFDRIDSEGNGFIRHSDLQRILGHNYEKNVVDNMIKEGDFKKNGRIDFEEFSQLMQEC